MRSCSPEPRLPISLRPSLPIRSSSLSDLKGRRVILAFYPADWSPVCGDQMTPLQRGASGVPQAWRGIARHLGRRRLVPPGLCEGRTNLHFPLIADFHPKGEIAKSFGAYREDEGVADRALFILDETGHIVWSYLLADRRQSRRRRDPRRARENAKAGDGRWLSCVSPSTKTTMSLGRPTLRSRLSSMATISARIARLPSRTSNWSFGISGAISATPTAISLISTVHPMAKPAAETAEFAGAHGLFWQMHSATVRQWPAIVGGGPCSRLRSSSGSTRPSFGLRSGAWHLCAKGRGRFPRRGPQRSERHAMLLHQWRAATTAPTGRRTLAAAIAAGQEGTLVQTDLDSAREADMTANRKRQRRSTPSKKRTLNPSLRAIRPPGRPALPTSTRVATNAEPDDRGDDTGKSE